MERETVDLPDLEFLEVSTPREWETVELPVW